MTEMYQSVNIEGQVLNDKMTEMYQSVNIEGQVLNDKND